MNKSNIFVGLLMFLFLSMLLGVVSAVDDSIGTISFKQEGAAGVCGFIDIYDVSDGYKLLKTYNLYAGHTSDSYKVPNELKFHELMVKHSWKGCVSPKESFVTTRMYNGGDMDIIFGKYYRASEAWSYSYVYGEYTVKDTSTGKTLGSYKVTKDQAKKGEKDDDIHGIIWEDEPFITALKTNNKALTDLFNQYKEHNIPKPKIIS